MYDQIVLGIVGIKNCGNYNSQTNYEKLNVVTYNGSTYCALKETKGNLPTDTNYWQLYASKGDIGPVGPAGPTGPTGPKGDPSGSPLAASNISEMTDTNKVYVNTSDGHWYYYNGTSWTNGGVYQSTEINDESIGVNNLNLFLQNHLHARTPSYTKVESSYINANGGVSSSNSFFYTSPIQLFKGETIKALVQGYSTSVALLSSCNSNGGNITPIIISENADEITIDYTASEDMYVILSTHKNHFLLYGVYKELVTNDELINQLNSIEIGIDSLNSFLQNHLHVRTVSYNMNDGSYINSLGVIKTSSSFKMSSPIQLFKGETIKALVQGYSTDIALLSSCNSNGGNITPIIISENADEITIDYTASEDMYVILSTHKNHFLLYGVYKELVTNDEISSLNNNIKGIYKNAVFCGDSLTFGATYTSSTSPRSYRNYYNYPHYVKKLMDIDTIEEYAFGGATATTWWNSYQNNISSDNCLYFVWLGTNSTFTDTVDTDCDGVDYTQYADNETGNMGRILAKISQLSNVKIVLLNCYASGSAENLTITNKVLNDFANKFNCIIVDMYNTDIKLSKYHEAYNGYYNAAHLNNAGYNRVAKIVYEKIIEEYCINCLQFEHYKAHE